MVVWGGFDSVVVVVGGGGVGGHDAGCLLSQGANCNYSFAAFPRKTGRLSCKFRRFSRFRRPRTKT